ncbi:MAG: peptidylprolyl isomerase [Chloroflexota bacterium]|nr:peptidylprolyl isomerase [Chloroflexota bacterium]
MVFRNRATLDRKHRPRWQDELRSQQLIVAGFAVAIAVALGIFAATAYGTYYDAHLREVAVVAGVGYDRDALNERKAELAADLSAIGTDIQNHGGGARSDIVQQQLQAISQEIQNLDTNATDSLVTGALMRSQAARLEITLPDSEINAEIARRTTLPFRIQLSIITANALPADAASGAKPTDAQFAAAKVRAQAIYDQVQGGADFATLAKQKSDDAPTKAQSGLAGWVQTGDASYGTYFDAAKKAKAGDLLGPIKTDTGYTVVRVDALRPATSNALLKNLLDASHVSDADYRSYVTDELLKAKYQSYFGTTVIGEYVDQRQVAQIQIAPDANNLPLPQVRVRHILIQPLPGADDQSKATDVQWKAALAKAQGIRAEAIKPGADWDKLALESADTGTRTQGGDLGWVDPTNSGFVAEFQTAINRLRPGDVSEPVKSQFGYHLIQVTDKRIGAQDEVDRVVAALKKDPSAFVELAKRDSIDYATRNKGGDIGWVAPYEKEAAQETAIVGLAKVGAISAPVKTTGGIYIFKLLAIAPHKFLDADRRSTIQNTGFDRWLTTLKSDVGVWLDPQFQSTASATG